MTEERRASSLIPRPSAIVPRLRRALRGEVDAIALMREAFRRSAAAIARDRERSRLELLDKTPARLLPPFKGMDGEALLEHFRQRDKPSFLPGFKAAEIKEDLYRLLHEETRQLVREAARITDEHSWPLMGFGERRFGDRVEWRRDPLSGYEWPLDFHADIVFSRNDGSDVRVLWELNRLGHLVTLARAYGVTGDEGFSREFFLQLESWREQNPVGLGANWSCAMEVALRAMNLLAAFEIFRRSAEMTKERLMMMLSMLDQHGAHIHRNLEFSYIATSNHYLSDVVGLLWLGVMLPELSRARTWRRFGLREMLREMFKQVLPDGADFEASTGYHRLVLELFLYSFILCRENGVEIEALYWLKLQQMFEYMRSLIKPEGRAPLIGDTDSGRVLPIKHRSADDHAYLLALGAALLQARRFKITEKLPEEVAWILGREGVQAFESLPSAEEEWSRGFEHAGTYVMRERDLYLLFNASGVGARGRGSHGHNDALSLEVSACGTSFIIDPGTYVYTADLEERNRFRSTRYHSTVEIDGEEQNSTNPSTPFVMGDEAHPRVLEWKTAPDSDFIRAEHSGYARLHEAVATCARSVSFDKRKRLWLVEDSFLGAGEHTYSFRFHFAPGLKVRVLDEMVEAGDESTGARLFVAPLNLSIKPALEDLFASTDYGAKAASLAARWTLRASVPLKALWAIVPVCKDEGEEERLSLIKSFV